MADELSPKSTTHQHLALTFEPEAKRSLFVPAAAFRATMGDTAIIVMGVVFHCVNILSIRETSHYEYA